MRSSNLLGPWGEALAAEYLRRRGYRIEAMNFRTRMGEIDIVATKQKYLVFVEVKLRKSDQYGEAKEFVTGSKQEKLKAAAGLYLAGHETERQPRFDVIEIYAPEGISTIKPQINHIENAFF